MHRTQRGMSLVEIMVAVVIGLIGILIITQAYIASDNFNRSTLGEGGAQTNGVIALYTIERDARMAGYGLNNSGALGCGNIYWYYDPSYSSNVGGGTLPNLTLAPAVITVGGTASTPDQITIMYSSTPERMFPTTLNAFNASSSEISVDGTEGFYEGDLILLVGPTGCTLGKVTQVQPGPQKIQVNPGASAPQNPPGWGSFPTTYNSGDTMANLGDPIVRTYRIGSGASAGRLQIAEGLLSAGSATAVDLVDEVVDLRAQYGKDTDGDGIVDAWNNTAPATSTEWLRVNALRIGLLARIGTYEKPSGTDCDATTTIPSWSGAAGSPFGAISVAAGSEDRCYRYRVFETTVPLRNMIWKVS
jgi:type IV pilus assembly protein PilW